MLGGEVLTPQELGSAIGSLSSLFVRDLTLGSCLWDKTGVQTVSNIVNVPVGGSPGTSHPLGHVKYRADGQGVVIDVKTPFEAAKYKATPEPLMAPLPETKRGVQPDSFKQQGAPPGWVW